MIKNIIIEADSASPLETERIGREFAALLPLDAFVAMYGDLGAGKTAFVRGMASELVPDATVTSPTYTLVNEYRGKDRLFCHFDMYRISDEDDLYSIGFYDYADCVIAAEWCEKIPFALPDAYYSVTITKLMDADSSSNLDESPEDKHPRRILIEKITN